VKAQHSLAALLQIIVTAFMPVCGAFRSKMGPQHSFPSMANGCGWAVLLIPLHWVLGHMEA
jgi:hypothetical protein